MSLGKVLLNVFLCIITGGLWLLVLLVKFLMSNSKLSNSK